MKDYSKMLLANRMFFIWDFTRPSREVGDCYPFEDVVKFAITRELRLIRIWDGIWRDCVSLSSDRDRPPSKSSEVFCTECVASDRAELTVPCDLRFCRLIISNNWLHLLFDKLTEAATLGRWCRLLVSFLTLLPSIDIGFCKWFCDRQAYGLSSRCTVGLPTNLNPLLRLIGLTWNCIACSFVCMRVVFSFEFSSFLFVFCLFCGEFFGLRPPPSCCLSFRFCISIICRMFTFSIICRIFWSIYLLLNCEPYKCDDFSGETNYCTSYCADLY